MIIDCVDEAGYLSEHTLAKIKQASDEVFRQEFQQKFGRSDAERECTEDAADRLSCNAEAAETADAENDADNAGNAENMRREQLNEAERKALLEVAGCDMLDDAASNRLEVSVTITDEETIQAINAEYRGIDKVTDVLSFPQYNDAEDVMDELEMLDPEISVLLGDVVICYKRACEQAVEYGNSEDREITYLFVHSMMHLLGYDHMEEEERRVMRMHEERVMDAIDLRRE